MTHLDEFINSNVLGELYYGNSGSSEESSVLFTNPLADITAAFENQISDAFQSIENALKKGFFVSGYFSYELGYFLDTTGCEFQPNGNPLLHFRVYTEKHDIPSKECHDAFQKYVSAQTNDYWIKDIRQSISKEAYRNQIEKIHEYIKNGDTYQVNFTFKLLSEFYGNPFCLFYDLSRVQKTSYTVFMKFSDRTILSFSPELFFLHSNDTLTLKPMKGTIKRGMNPQEDEIQTKLLSESEKTKAENLMIVDMERNDLGKICPPGGVCVDSLFDIEKYETLFQMTSTIRALCKDDTPLSKIIYALFPSGSVTGAPKIRTMQIIQELEKEPRGIYTGALGFIHPKGGAIFNIPIRTIEHNPTDQTLVMGVGSGIVADSEAEDEYRECLLKGKFLTDRQKDFQLIETMRWDSKTGYFLLDEHLERLKQSSDYFHITCDIDKIKEGLKAYSQFFDSNLSYRVRLLHFADGHTEYTHTPLKTDTDLPCTIILDRTHTVNQNDLFLFHK
ncbi:aminodeoxychorismate synthase component I, partial [PVC group bacterium]|nr:aminodeoxychorismate synthase component I [PVC group bacterium]